METSESTHEREMDDRRREGIISEVEGFNERARGAVRDDELQEAVTTFQDRAVAARDAVLHALPEAPELREKAYHIKQQTMANLDRYLEQMADAVERRDGKVFFAKDGDDVVRYVGDLARRKGAKVITKSKSMATEEIELNHRLEEEYADLDLEIVETDLGEWIAQLAGQTPSHIVGPILHMNRRQVAEVISGAAGEKMPPDVEALGTFARKWLREKFLAANIGITGANFGVAETGTIATITNEGNARLVTSVPPVHVVVMGIEKMIPRFADLSVFVQLLGRSGTGQKITVYTNFITGPRGEGELDGAEEFHLILLDNGRSKLLGTEFEEALYCIRCGACLNVCPVYRQTGGHAYGSTYSGPIGAVITPLLKGTKEAKDLPFASSLCGACWEACPVGIPLHDLLLKLRNRQVEEGVRSKAETLMFKGFERTMKRPAAYKISGRIGKLAQKPAGRDGSIGPLPSPTGPWTNSRDLPQLAEKSFRQLWKEGI